MTWTQLSKIVIALLFPRGDRANAEHTRANLLSCNAASPVASPDHQTQIQNGRAVVMAKVIEFYIPNRFQKKVAWVPPQERGKVIEFCSQVKKSA